MIYINIIPLLDYITDIDKYLNFNKCYLIKKETKCPYKSHIKKIIFDILKYRYFRFDELFQSDVDSLINQYNSGWILFEGYTNDIEDIINFSYEFDEVLNYYECYTIPNLFYNFIIELCYIHNIKYVDIAKKILNKVKNNYRIHPRGNDYAFSMLSRVHLYYCGNMGEYNRLVDDIFKKMIGYKENEIHCIDIINSSLYKLVPKYSRSSSNGFGIVNRISVINSLYIDLLHYIKGKIPNAMVLNSNLYVPKYIPSYVIDNILSKKYKYIKFEKCS